MRNRPLGSFCLAVFLFLCLLIQAGGDRFVKERSPSPLERSGIAGEKIRLSGRVYRKEQKDDCQIFYLKQVSVYDQAPSGAGKTSIFTEPKILIYDDQFTPAAIGSELMVSGKVTLYERERNPGNFNQKLYYQRQDIHGYVWASSVKILQENEKNFREWLYQFRTRWRENLLQVLGERDGSVLAAMLLGDKNGMDPEVKELYQANGIGHVLAISGLHLSFIGLGIYGLLRRLSGSYPAAGLGGILFLSLYVLLIGLTVSVLRALIMFLFRVGADMTGRHYDGPTALAVAAVAVLLWRPLYLYDGGFWMSFGAILAVQLILPLGQGTGLSDSRTGTAAATTFSAKILQKCHSFWHLLFTSFWASTGITTMLLPVLLWFFFEIPVYSVFLNLVVIPLLSALLFLGLIGSLLCLLWEPIGAFVLKVCGVIFRLYEALCHGALILPGARQVIGQPNLWQIFAYYVCLALALILLWRFKKWREETREDRETALRVSLGKERRLVLRKVRRTCLMAWIRSGLIIGVGLFLLCLRFGERDTFVITMLDVGQGDGIFLQSPDGTACFVDGGSSDVKQVGKYRIEPFLKSRGVDRLDYVFISHADSDHINGIQEMMERQKIGVRIGCLVLPDRKTWDDSLLELAQQALDCGVTVAVIETGQTFAAEDLTLTCLWPGAESAGSDVNELSMVLALSFGDFDMLFTGDLGQEEEGQVLENLGMCCPGRHFEVLKTAHHGSKNSSSSEFLEEIRPEYALISAGRNNIYGHPHAETLERLEEAGSSIYCTQDTGAITITVNQKENWFKIEKYCGIN